MPYAVSTDKGNIPDNGYGLIVASAVHRLGDGTMLPVIDDLETWNGLCAAQGIDYLYAEVGELLGMSLGDRPKPIYKMPDASALRPVVQRPTLVTFDKPGTVSLELRAAVEKAVQKAVGRTVQVNRVDFQDPFEAPYHITVVLGDGSRFPVEVAALAEDQIVAAVRRMGT